jgi:hypothetical protein
MMFTIRNAAALTAGLLALLGSSALASVQPAASAINVDGMGVVPRAQLEARFPDLSSKEVDRLMFRIADARSMALLLGKVG